jgi:hypothetical protein
MRWLMSMAGPLRVFDQYAQTPATTASATMTSASQRTARSGVIV